MSEVLSQGLTLVDFIGADKNLNLHTGLEIMFGVGTNSNTYKINQLLEQINTSIDDLESRNALTDVNATYVSESGGVENFTGVVPDITQYNVGMVLIFTIPQNNKGAISINLNSLGVKSIKKYNSSGSLVDLEADDFVRNHKYFLEYDGTQFVTLCENSVQELKQLNTKLQAHEDDTTIHITSEERESWNGKSVVTKSEINGNVKVNDEEIVVYTHPSGTNPHGTTKEDVGLGNVANERQYSAENPPPYPVTSVNGKTGAAVLKTSDIENDLNYQTGDDVSGSVTDAINALKGSVPEALNTLQKLAATINNDANYHTTVDNALDGKAAKDLSNVENATLLDKGKAAGLLDSATAATTYVAKDTYDADQELLEDDIAELQTTTGQLESEKADKTELPHKVVTVTLDVEGWQDDSEEQFSHAFTDSNITATDKLNVAPSTDTMIGELVELGVTAIVAKNDNGTASIIFYGAKPTTELSFQVEIVPVNMIGDDA